MSAETAPLTAPSEFHPALRFIAKVISVVFHPLFIPVYVIWFLLYPAAFFPGISGAEKFLHMLRFIVMYTVFPLATVVLLRLLGFVTTIHLKEARDRIIPYIACGIYYFWMWYVLKNQPDWPRELVMLTLAIFLASSAGLIVNSFVKVSMHAMSLGVMTTFILLLSFSTDLSMGFYISIALLITGVVCTARMINSDHRPFEIYLGLFIGMITQVIAWLVA